MAHPSFFFAEEWHFIQLILPSLGQLDGIIFDLFTFNGVSQRIWVVNNLFNLIWKNCIPDTEKIFFITLRTFCEFLRKIFLQLRLFGNLGVQVFNTDLIPVRWINEFNLLNFKEVFLTAEHRF